MYGEMDMRFWSEKAEAEMKDVKDVGEALTREQPAFRLAATPLRSSRDRGARLHNEEEP